MSTGPERLRTLYQLLLEIPAARIKIDEWRRSPDNDIEETEVTDEELRTHCGTVACAVGWACSFAPFIDEGLRYGIGAPVFGAPVFGTLEGWDAVAQFFDVDAKTAFGLFGGPDVRYTEAFDSVRMFFDPGLDNEVDDVVFDRLGDKGVILMRLRNYLRSEGHIDQAEFEAMCQAEVNADWCTQ